MPAGTTTSVASTTRDELTVVDLSEAPDGDENYPVVEVEANDNTFGVNALIRMRPGTEVQWTNIGRNDQNIIPLEPSKQFGVGQRPGDPRGARGTWRTCDVGHALPCTNTGIDAVGTRVTA